MFALGTALCTALGGLILVEVTGRAGGAMAVSRWRTLSATLALGLLALTMPGGKGLGPGDLGPVILSSLTAAALAEWALNASYLKIGARRTALLFSLAAPFSALLGWLVLGETLSSRQMGGGLLVVGGIVLAILFGPRPAAVAGEPSPAAPKLHHEVRGAAGAYLVGLVAAVGQAYGTILVRPVMARGADPVTVMAVRAAVAALVFWSLFGARRLLAGRSRREVVVPPLGILFWVIVGAMVSFVIGMSLMMAALADTAAGIASTLAATTPAVVLPLLWLRTGRRPGWQAWLGAVAVVLGCALVLLP